MPDSILAKQSENKNDRRCNLLAEAEIDGFQIKRRSNSKGGQYNGRCILGCDGLGDDRLRIQPNNGFYGWFICDHCNSKGSLIDWLIIKRGMSKISALQYVGWTPKDGNSLLIPDSAFNSVSSHTTPSQLWQSAGRAFVEYCESLLWSEPGTLALTYLHRRGFADETIKAAHLGYNPALMYRDGSKWGCQGTMCLFKGIVIPWFIEGSLWRITVRDESVMDGHLRYKQIAGGSNGLYLADFLYQSKPVLLCEGEFDALSIAQECGHHVVAVATGSTYGSRMIRWVAELARCESVFIVFDAERDKGDKEASWWQQRVTHAQRLRPWWKDANQMLQDGADLMSWIQSRLNQFQNQSQIGGTGSAPSHWQFHQARHHLSQLRAGILCEREALGPWENIMLDIEYIWMRLERTCRSLPTLSDIGASLVWNGKPFEDALLFYVDQHPDARELVCGTTAPF